MAIIGLNLTAERKFVSKYDPAKGTKDATEFTIGSLDSRILGVLQDKATSIKVNPSAPDEDVDTQINSKAFQFEVCQFGIRGWKNFKDEKGDDINFVTNKLNRGGKSYTVVQPDLVSQIPQIVIEEMSAAIMKGNVLDEDEGNA